MRLRGALITRAVQLSSSVTNLPSQISAWQCLNFIKPGVNDLTSELHRTTTRRMPVIARPDHVLIRVHASTVNPIDVLNMYGYGSALFRLSRQFAGKLGWMGTVDESNGSDFPFTPGRDFVGEVVQLGPEGTNSTNRIRGCNQVASVEIGQRVVGATWPFLSTSGSGAFADYVVCPVSYLSVVPDNVTSLDAVAVGYAGLTAWSALDLAGIKPPLGQDNDDGIVKSRPLILVNGATGGVGLIAAQLARLWHAKVHVTCPADAKAKTMMKSLDVDEIFTYPDRPPVGTLYDVIIDCVRPETLPTPATQSRDQELQWLLRTALPEVPSLMRYLKPSSKARYIGLNSPALYLMDQLGVIPGAGMAAAQLMTTQLLAWLPGSSPSLRQLRWAFFKPSGTRLSQMLHWLSRGDIKVFVDSVYTLDQLPEALAKTQGRGVRGKVVVKTEAFGPSL